MKVFAYFLSAISLIFALITPVHALPDPRNLPLPSMDTRISSVFLALFPTYLQKAQPWCERTQEPQHVLSFFSSEAAPSQVVLEVVDSDEANAYALKASSQVPYSPPKILLSSKLLALIQTESELAFVLSHEMVHLSENHFTPAFSQAMFTSRQIAHMTRVHHSWEFLADSLSEQRLRERGFDASSGRSLLHRLHQVNTRKQIENQSATVKDEHQHHPSLWARLEALSLQTLLPGEHP